MYMESVRFPSRGGFSVRSIFTFVLATILVALLWTLSLTTTTHAADSGAKWSGDSILFENHGYTLAEEGSFKDASNAIPAEATVYKTPVQTVGTGASASQRVFIIYFSNGVDPPTETSAHYVEFDYKNGSLSNPQNQKQIAITVKADQDGLNSSCSVSGIGWIVCPLSVFLADAMDKIFDILTGFIETQPLVLGDSNSSLYVAWNLMRTVANIVFVIVFLIIIYSQLTSLGVSNYGLKKITPRLIVAAILVNLSFYISALAIDVSNILGYSIQDVFKSISDATFHLTNDNVGGWNTTTSPWAGVTAVILAGGGLVGGVWYMAEGGLYLLMPLLLGLILTLILVVVILAARQAIIVILVIIAPLAFVANLLPNTEKWFDKWKDLFMTMLIFFPAFSLVFGASQLAGQIIIQNAGDNIVTLLFGLAVQIAPLVITPLILKLSGGLLGKIAGIANNPRKGIIDRNRQAMQQRAAITRGNNIEKGVRPYNPASWGAGMVRHSDKRKRYQKDRLDMLDQVAANRYQESSKYSGIKKNGEHTRKPGLHEQKANVDMHKERIHADHAAHVDHLKSTNGTPLNTTAQLMEASKLRAEGAQSSYNAYVDTLKATAGSQLNAPAVAMEASKLRAEGAQSNYISHIEGLKLQANTSMGDAARLAQTNKILVEAAQQRVQAMLDDEVRKPNSLISDATIALEEAKLLAEESKNLSARYITDAKLTVESDIHLAHVRTENAKLFAQVGEASLTRMTEEYKTGKLLRDGELKVLSEAMVVSVENKAAEDRGAQAAQNIQQHNVANAFTETVDAVDANGQVILDANNEPIQVPSARAEKLVKTAASVDPQGATRARAAATATIARIEREALENNTILLESRAEDSNMNNMAYADKVYKDHIALSASDPTYQPDDAILEAALNLLASDGDIVTIRDALMHSDAIDKDMMTRVVSRNKDSMIKKGGFDIVQKMGDLYGATREEMDLSIAESLSGVTAENISGQKFGWWKWLSDEPTEPAANGKSYASNFERIVDTTFTIGTKAQQNRLKASYGNITAALSSQEIMGKIGDRSEITAKLHEVLHNRPELHDDGATIDYELIRRGLASNAENRAAKAARKR